ncbi:DNA glycosylase [Gongronella butleri]|nr:DNA glycosylase [Gongronella butleri]
MQRRSTRLASSLVADAVIKSEPAAAALSSPAKKRKIKTEASPYFSSSQGKKKSVPPHDWKEVFDKIKAYRQTHPAVVDTMGCACLAEREKPVKQQRFQTLVSLMLSSQTKDTVTSVVVRRLQADLPGGLSIDSILDVDEKELDDMIRTVGFHSRKAGYIKQTARILRDQYDDDIPDTIEGLMSLPGVGPKMGYLALQNAWNKNMGIGVDVHVHRISNRLGWCKTDKGGPEDTRLSLQSWLPKEHWNEINPMLVGYGQSLCLPRGPKCDECPVNDTCPSSMVKKSKKKVVKKEEHDHDAPLLAVKPEPIVKNEPLEW